MASVAITCPAGAGGYYSGSVGARAAGRGGAFTVKADDLSAAAVNPAGLTRAANMLHVGNKFSYNQQRYRRANSLNWRDLDANGNPPVVTFEEVENQAPFQALGPIVGVSSDFGLEDWAFALVAYAPAGIARQEFPLDGGQRYMMVARNTMMVHYTFNAAWKYDDVFGIGVGFQWISVPELTYEIVVNGSPSGPINPASSNTDLHSRFQGSDLFTPNLMVGAWVQLSPSWQAAVAGQVLPAQLVLNGRLRAQSLNQQLIDSIVPSPGEPPETGRAVLTPTDEMDLTLPLPLVGRAGIRYIHQSEGRDVFDLEANVVYETWSRVERFRLDGRGITATFVQTDVDVGLLDVEKQWNDTVGVQLGGDFRVSDGVTLRAGAFYESAVAPKAYMNVDFPAGQQMGGALGASLHIGGLELALAQEYRFQPTVAVPEAEGKVYQQVPGSRCQPPYDHPLTCNPNQPGQPSPTVNAGLYSANSWVTTLDVLYRF